MCALSFKLVLHDTHMHTRMHSFINPSSAGFQPATSNLEASGLIQLSKEMQEIDEVQTVN